MPHAPIPQTEPSPIELSPPCPGCPDPDNAQRVNLPCPGPGLIEQRFEQDNVGVVLTDLDIVSEAIVFCPRTKGSRIG